MTPSTLEKELEFENNLNSNNQLIEVKEKKEKEEIKEIKEYFEPKMIDVCKKGKKKRHSVEVIESKKVNKTFQKSNSFVLKPNSKYMNINNIMDDPNAKQINSFQFSKSKTVKENEAFNTINFYSNFHNLQGHLETVRETISEVSNSKIESKKSVIKQLYK